MGLGGTFYRFSMLLASVRAFLHLRCSWVPQIPAPSQANTCQIPPALTPYVGRGFRHQPRLRKMRKIQPTRVLVRDGFGHNWTAVSSNPDETGVKRTPSTRSSVSNGASEQFRSCERGVRNFSPPPTVSNGAFETISPFRTGRSKLPSPSQRFERGVRNN